MDPILPPPKPTWRDIKEFIRRNAVPKKYPKPPKVNRGPRGGPSSDRLAFLSTQSPRKIYVHPLKDKCSAAYHEKHLVKEGALNYVATARIIELAEPRHKFEPLSQKPLVKEEALQYIASPRIIEISLPMHPRRKWKKKRPVWVKKSALTAKASQRVTSLAQPNPRQNPPCKDGFSVNPAALTAYASKRIRLLARPRPLYTHVREHPINPKYRKSTAATDDDDEEEE